MMADTTAIGTMTADLPEFADLVRAYQRMVFSIAYHFLHDRAGAEDIAQEVFLQLHQTLSSLKSEAHIRAWLCKVTSHRCIDYARSRKADLPLDRIPEPVSKPSSGDPLMAALVQRAVASLPPKVRIVVVLRYQEDLEPAEIARVLGLRVNTVKSQLHRSLDILRQKLGGTLGDVES
jgi:RNA polymerase sigma-70 factor (ECF subfamily)